jgi:hypothetical protein
LVDFFGYIGCNNSALSREVKAQADPFGHFPAEFDIGLQLRADISDLFVSVTHPEVFQVLRDGVLAEPCETKAAERIRADWVRHPACSSLAMRRCCRSPSDHRRSSAATLPFTLSEYPSLPQRQQTVQKEIVDNLPQRDGSVTSSQEFEEFKKHLESMKPKSAP